MTGTGGAHPQPGGEVRQVRTRQAAHRVRSAQDHAAHQTDAAQLRV